MDYTNYEKLSDVFKSLAHPVRLQILTILRHEPACVCHINAILDQRQAYISQQLAVLKEAEIVSSEKIGWNVFYRIKNPLILEAIDSVQNTVAPDYDVIDLGVVERCPCPKCSSEK